MMRILWLLHHARNAVLAWAAIGLLILNAVFWFATVRPLQREVDALHLQAEERQKTLPLAVDRDEDPGRVRARQLIGFYRFFASGGSLTDQLARLQGIAESNGIRSRQADYRLVPLPGQRLDRYQVTINTVAPYAAVRGFVAQSLGAIPTLALSEFHLQRKAIVERNVEARLTFTLFVEK